MMRMWRCWRMPDLPLWESNRQRKTLTSFSLVRTVVAVLIRLMERCSNFLFWRRCISSSRNSPVTRRPTRSLRCWLSLVSEALWSLLSRSSSTARLCSLSVRSCTRTIFLDVSWLMPVMTTRDSFLCLERSLSSIPGMTRISTRTTGWPTRTLRFVPRSWTVLIFRRPSVSLWSVSRSRTSLLLLK